MPQDITLARHVQGHHQQRMAARAPAIQPIHLQHRLIANGPLHIRNGRDCVVAALLLNAALSTLRLPGEPTLPTRSAQAGLRPHAAQPPSRSTGVAGVHAASATVQSPEPASSTAQHLQQVGNLVLGGCIARPRDCPQALVAGAVASAGVLAASGLEQLGTTTWPAAANAAVMPPAVNWIDQLAELLGTRISAEQAALELDINAIAQATRAAQDGYNGLVQRRTATNQARLDTIVRCFERDGHTVERLPFSLPTHTLHGQAFEANGTNLRVTFSGAGTPTRTLMLIAHGDVKGAEIGSTGSLDNGLGVAMLLALARELSSTGLPDGTRVQLLVTDLEEAGLKGAKAYVRDCQAALDCPDVALNLNLLGYGDGVALSGSTEHGRFRDGDSLPEDADTRTASAAEAELDQLIRIAAADVGLQVHATPGWTLQSDQVAFQRRGVPALGLTGMDAVDILPERALQQARARYLDAEARVTPERYDAYLAGRFNRTQTVAMERDIHASNTAALEYQALPQSRRQRRVHNAADQAEHVDMQQALATLRLLRRTVTAWLSAPRPDAAR